MSLPFLDLAGIGAKSVVTVGACASVGVYAHRRGVLTHDAEQSLAKLISSIYLPCLILVQVTPHMRLGTLLDIWPLAAMCLCTVAYGLVMGFFLSRSIPKFRGLLMVAAAFPNSFSVPLTLLLAVGDQPALQASGQ